eukprot:TRINITY_DN3932_c0_g1_i13.p1 TRINITY_DN3932_c0_g1~~TRINITY_DN3932_c0_g1_i13.p1  ORF type:complete len:228 (-),score=-12.50 TRINITY_DN3932_c0_g1_i13:12-695(-)
MLSVTLISRPANGECKKFQSTKKVVMRSACRDNFYSQFSLQIDLSRSLQQKFVIIIYIKENILLACFKILQFTLFFDPNSAFYYLQNNLETISQVSLQLKILFFEGQLLGQLNEEKTNEHITSTSCSYIAFFQQTLFYSKHLSQKNSTEFRMYIFLIGLLKKYTTDPLDHTQFKREKQLKNLGSSTFWSTYPIVDQLRGDFSRLLYIDIYKYSGIHIISTCIIQTFS